ncbi:fusion protein [Salmon aquaparamyxovirus]|uniref:Fusion glycoprotein F0 n=2 Tax=Salmon aquaparamyxovirus TaxID=381543 RepID=B2BX76_9MONO|nr:fusion protein [Salmon aquaparamyxovirus]ABW38054.1 fusion protein [Salmon aquaparamyxovirus]ABX57741.1 fusion protein [Salmon aquaparamyxovirus]
MDGPKFRFVLLILLTAPARGQVDYDKLLKVGIFEKGTANLKISVSSQQRYMVIKMMPNLGPMNQCGIKEVNLYKESILRLITPISTTLNYIKSEIQVEREVALQPNGTIVRFFGLIVAAGALTLATSAQITAGIALHNSLENAKAIKGLTDAIKESNLAIQKIQDATAGTVIALNALQDQVNTNIIPAINTLGCTAAGNTLGIALTRYYSELIMIFGPSLGNPVEAPLTIQALAGAFNGDLHGMIREYGYTPSDIEDILRTNSVTGRVIDVDLVGMNIVLEINLPTLYTLRDTKIVNLGKITYNVDGSEWQTLVPEWLAIRNTLMGGVDLSRCVVSSRDLICKQDPVFSLDTSIISCLNGNTESCPRNRVVNSVAPRYAVIRGNILANCISTTCLCGDPGVPIIQKGDNTLTAMSINDCKLVGVDGYVFRPGPKAVNVTFNLPHLNLGPEVNVNPVDISGALGKVEQDLASSRDHLAKSEKILSGINPNIINTEMVLVAVILSLVCAMVVIGIVCWLSILTKWVRSCRADCRRPNKGPDLGPIMSSQDNLSF